MKKEVFVSFDYFFEVFLVNRFLSWRILFLETFFQHLRRGLQIDNQVGRGKLCAKVIVIAIIGFQFLIGEIEAREELVFFKNEIGDYRFLRSRSNVQCMKLLKAANEKSELRLKSGTALAIVKGAKKWIIVGLHYPLGIETFSQNPRQRALSDAYRTFHGDVTGQFEKISHELEEYHFEWQDIPPELRTQLREE